MNLFGSTAGGLRLLLDFILLNICIAVIGVGVGRRHADKKNWANVIR